MKVQEIKPADDHFPTIYERDGRWFWADECWQEHGPCSSRESAVRRQDLYIKLCLEGLADGAPAPVSAQEWSAAKEREPEDELHPCDDSAAWDCMCAGACSCHWMEP